VSALLDRCLLTWPASLYAAFHGTVLTCMWAEKHPSKRSARWLSRLAILAFVVVGYGFFELCRAVGMFIGWSFLFGFPVAFPFTILAVRAQRKRQPIGVIAGWTLLAFAAFFWTCQGLLLWKAARAT